MWVFGGVGGTPWEPNLLSKLRSVRVHGAPHRQDNCAVAVGQEAKKIRARGIVRSTLKAKASFKLAGAGNNLRR